jgi:hypothetical protein
MFSGVAGDSPFLKPRSSSWMWPNSVKPASTRD